MAALRSSLSVRRLLPAQPVLSTTCLSRSVYLYENIAPSCRRFSTSPPPAPRALPRVTSHKLRGWPRRGDGPRLVALTAYDYPTALHAERAGVDVVLVGDSLGMVVLGHTTTQPVTLEDMLHHTRAARRAVDRAMLVADLPFGSYEVREEDAMRAAYELVKRAGADAVKIEGGGTRRVAALRAIVDGGVAAIGHVGLTPQTVSVTGGFRSVGRDASAASRVLDDALELQDAGACAVVVECVPEAVARAVTDALDVPTIGIGAGKECTGQVLVYHDMLGLMAHPHHTAVAPKFSKQFAEVGPIVDAAIRKYGAEVREARFPSSQFSPYKIHEHELLAFEEYASKVARRRKLPAASEDTEADQRAEDDLKVY